MDQLFAEEFSEKLSEYVSSELQASKEGHGPRRRRFEFNRFDVTVDLDADEVLIEDDLCLQEETEQRVSVAEFSAALNKRYRSVT